MKSDYTIVKTKQQMADEYGICIKTFSRLLKLKRIKLDRGLICPKDQQLIYEELGFPKSTQKLPYIP
jgi:hypothetical protein